MRGCHSCFGACGNVDVVPFEGSCLRVAGDGPGVETDCPKGPRWNWECGAFGCPNVSLLVGGMFVMGCGVGAELYGGAGEATRVVPAEGRLSLLIAGLVSSGSELRIDIRFDFLGGSAAGVGAGAGVGTFEGIGVCWNGVPVDPDPGRGVSCFVGEGLYGPRPNADIADIPNCGPEPADGLGLTRAGREDRPGNPLRAGVPTRSSKSRLRSCAGMAVELCGRFMFTGEPCVCGMLWCGRCC